MKFPFGRNLHEDLIGVAGHVQRCVRVLKKRNILHEDDENSTIHDEVGMRHITVHGAICWE